MRLSVEGVVWMGWRVECVRDTSGPACKLADMLIYDQMQP